MKSSKILAVLLASAALLTIPAKAQTFSFGLIKTAGSTCKLNPFGWVVDRSFGTVELLTVNVAGLPPNTDFDLFNIQVPHAKFGLAWYLGDIQTNKAGVGIGTFIGRFNKETFIISQQALPSPNVFRKPPAVLAQSTTGVQVDPVQIYHLGLWFNSVNDAVKAGCPNTATPFNGEHNAGVQILNTGQFPDNAGPLFHLQ
jgi:hypothetical protein